jgi:cytochrome bd ubiquinol oxidase subunit I
MDALTVDRIYFAFTATFHYLFPQPTGSRAPYRGTQDIRASYWNGRYDEAARLWGRIFGINFVGVVTGIPLEFQFGTN